MFRITRKSLAVGTMIAALSIIGLASAGAASAAETHTTTAGAVTPAACSYHPTAKGAWAAGQCGRRWRVWVYCAYNNGSHGYVYGPMADNSRNAYSARFCANGRRYSSGIQRF